ncbi:MAG TPA: hypothetical protein VIK80_00885 [Flavihumibacter sp.]|jgi:hypothetical protein
MKNFIPGFLALLIALGLGLSKSGIASSMDNEPVYRWHEYNWAGTAEIYPPVIFEGTPTEAMIMFNCWDSGFRVCARAYEFNNIPTGIYLMKD